MQRSESRTRKKQKSRKAEKDRQTGREARAPRRGANEEAPPREADGRAARRRVPASPPASRAAPYSDCWCLQLGGAGLLELPVGDLAAVERHGGARVAREPADVVVEGVAGAGRQGHDLLLEDPHQALRTRRGGG